MPLSAPPASPLINFLKRKNLSLYGKVSELRGQVTPWLTYVPQTFGHYTRHTIDHSDEIVLQISKILFQPNKATPEFPITPLEAYILIAGAYLHDAGMVVSEREKQEVLASDDWKAWVTEGGGANRWKKIQELRDAAGSDNIKHFGVDRATRLLMAEYFRRQHHRRAGELARGRALELGRFDIGEPMLRAAIADICIAHGLDAQELEDNKRFPEARDILGERVNIRLLATLLRLGDLLDLRHDRACPILHHAACPLPADSYAHWSQFEALKHPLTSPERIEIHAECRNQEEHRVLYDWCSWIIKELGSLPSRLPKTDWRPPYASINRHAHLSVEPNKDVTIRIERAPGATYIPGDWKFELEEEAVFQRLVSDVYDTPNAFLKELIQNALDATRCRIYMDTASKEVSPPEFPTQFPEQVRDKYPLRISLREELVDHPESGEKETIQVLAVEDQGIGMDIEVVQRYLLQAGRSYYTTADFRRAFSFQPTSRFGIGFLSVFAVSENVTIETFKPSSLSGDGAIRIRLTGYRNYILVDKIPRDTPGTLIEVRLRKKLALPLKELIRQWCVFVEFPIEIDDLGERSVLRAERAEDFIGQWQSPLKSDVQYVLRCFSTECASVQGNIYVLSRIEGSREHWVSEHERSELLRHGLGRIPVYFGDLLAYHGIAVGHHSNRNSRLVQRLDFRKNLPVNLERRLGAEIEASELDERLVGLLEEHLGPEGGSHAVNEWEYRTHLAADTRLAELRLWRTRRDMVLFWRNGGWEMCSVEKFLEENQWYMACGLDDLQIDEARVSAQLPAGAVLLTKVFALVADHYEKRTIWADVFGLVDVKSVKVASGCLVAELRRREPGSQLEARRSAYMRYVLPLEVPGIGFDLANFGGRYRGWVVVNLSSDFGAWYRRVVDACRNQQYGLGVADLERLNEFIGQAGAYSHGVGLRGLVEHLRVWNMKYGSQPEMMCVRVVPRLNKVARENDAVS